jgi:hypothetical protein
MGASFCSTLRAAAQGRAHLVEETANTEARLGSHRERGVILS